MADVPTVPQSRSPPLPDENVTHYCLRCRTKLPGRHPLDDHIAREGKCPRCNLPYDLARPETYSTHRMRMQRKFWIPGLVITIVAEFWSTPWSGLGVMTWPVLRVRRFSSSSRS